MKPFLKTRKLLRELILKAFKRKGFSLIEILIIITIIGILFSFVIINVRQAKEAAYAAVAHKELESVRTSIDLYIDDHGGYPADTDRDVPPGLEPYLAPGLWPDAAWPGSVFDWDNWIEPGTSEKIYQISIRFCPLGEPDQCRFPKEEWAADFDYFSSAYYCISGPCRSHISKPIDHPGYCVNCD